MGCNEEKEYQGSKKEDMWYGGLDALLIAGENAIKDVGDGDEETEDGSDGNIGGKDKVTKAKYQGVEDERGGEGRWWRRGDRGSHGSSTSVSVHCSSYGSDQDLALCCPVNQPKGG